MMAEQDVRAVTAAMLLIGNELLSGRTRDSNLAHFAQRLGERGIAMREVRIVSDVEAEIVAALNALRMRFDLVFTTGGIGPTHDDITADAVAKAFGVPIGEDARAIAILDAHYRMIGGEFTQSRRRMARIPQGADLIENPVSKAPGFRLGNVHVMAGVPRIAEAMLDAVMECLPRGIVRQQVTLTGAVAEGRIADTLRAIQDRYPDIEIGSYPSYGPAGPRTAIVIKGVAVERLSACAGEVAAMMRTEGVEPETEPSNTE